MDIRKGKVEKNREWSAATQKKLASMLGVSAMLSAAVLAACDLGANTADDVVAGPGPEGGIVAPEPTCGENPCGEFESSSSHTPKSSSSSRDIAPNSSSSMELLSGVSSSSVTPRPLSSDFGDPPSSSGVIAPFSSSSVALPPLSSSADYPPLAGVMPPLSSSSYSVDTLEITSGEIVPPLSSSSSEPEPLPGDPIELPEPLSGDVPPGDVIYIDDPKD